MKVGGSKSRTYNNFEPKSDQVQGIETSLGNIFQGSLDSFNSDEWQKRISNAQQRGDNAATQQDALLAQIPGLTNKNNEIVNKLTNLADTGQVPSTLLDNMNKSVSTGLQSSMGSMLNSLGNRGVLNSSITSKGVNNLAGNAANAMAQNYLSAYQNTSNTLSSALTGNQGNISSLISGANAYGAIPSQAYEQAYSPLTGAYNFWKDAESIRHSGDAYSHVVKQGK